MHLTALSEFRKLSTLDLRRAAVLEVRRRFGRPLPFDDAQFQAFLAGLRRTKGVRPSRKAALLEENLRAVMLLLDPETAPDLKRRLRDRALLLTGFAGGFRRSELAGFDLRDLSFTAEGLVQFVAGSKTDQGRRSEEVGIPGRAEFAALRRHRGLGLAHRPGRHARAAVLPHRPRRPSYLCSRRPAAVDRHQDRRPPGQAGDQGNRARGGGVFRA